MPENAAMTVLVTGGYGFIGSNFVRYWLAAHPDDKVVNLDLGTYAAVPESLRDCAADPRYAYVKADICDFASVDAAVKQYGVDCIVNFAAESHNSNSILNPTLFYQTNLMGLQTLLEAARQNPSVRRFHHVSTCEVYGDMALDSPDAFTETSGPDGNSPYSSSKACSNLAANAYFRTFGLPVTVSVCSNNYGPYQFPEKLIPVFITNLLTEKPLTLYKESDFKREWLFVDDHNRAIDLILQKGRPGETYNIGSGIEKSVEDIADTILAYFGLPAAHKTYVASRPSHDRRYLLDCTKIRSELDWRPLHSFEEGIRKTIAWYIDNPSWWEPLLARRFVSESNWKG